MFEQLVEQFDEVSQVTDIEIVVVTDEKMTEMNPPIDSSVLYVSKVRKDILDHFQERKKEKEKKEIYKERKDKEKQKEVTTKKYIFLDENDETYVVSKKAQAVLTKYHQKVQKDEDVTQWTAKQFHQYLIKKYRETYGHHSIEFGTVGGRKYGNSAHGIIWTIIKRKLIDVFTESKMSNQDLKIYIDWVYDIRSADLKFPATLNFLCSRSLISEWIYELNKKGKMPGDRVKITSKMLKFKEK